MLIVGALRQSRAASCNGRSRNQHPHCVLRDFARCLLAQVFLNYHGTSLPIPASLVPSRTTTVANVNSPNSMYGLVQVLAGANTSFALRFTGALSRARCLQLACTSQLNVYPHNQLG
jgi:hypothetical protein